MMWHLRLPLQIYGQRALVYGAFVKDVSCLQTIDLAFVILFSLLKLMLSVCFNAYYFIERRYRCSNTQESHALLYCRRCQKYSIRAQANIVLKNM